MRFGTVPTLWGSVPYDEVLAAIASTGYAGTELGATFPQDAIDLKPALERHGLVLSAAFVAPGLTDSAEVDDHLAALEPTLTLLAGCGGGTLLVAEPVAKPRAAIAGRVTQVGGVALSDTQWETLVGALHRLGARCNSLGLQLAFHPHAGSWVETPNEVQRLLNQTDPSLIGLGLDTGHIVFGGGNAVEAVDRFHRRLRYIQLKDVDPYKVVDMTSQGKDYAEAVRRGVFTELGKGCVDLAGIAGRLREHGYDGWVVVEQDTAPGQPCDAAKANREVLAGLFAPVSP